MKHDRFLTDITSYLDTICLHILSECNHLHILEESVRHDDGSEFGNHDGRDSRGKDNSTAPSG